MLPLLSTVHCITGFLTSLHIITDDTDLDHLVKVVFAGHFHCKVTMISRVKQITRPGWMHETSARTWCTGSLWEEPEGLGREGGGRGDRDGEYM